jgi:type IV pilus assembly protein PilV
MRLRPARRPLSGTRAAGFTLLEALAAMLVLTLGLLGLASLALGGLQSSRMALQHTEATALLADLADRIRANRAGGAAYALAEGVVVERPALPCSAVGECSAAALAALDLYAWQSEVAATLPEAQTRVTVVSASAPGARAYSITLRWRQSGDASFASVSMTVQA